MHRLKNMEETLVGCVQAQLANIANADTEELGQAVDMIKDLEQAMYYCEMVKCLKEDKEEKKEIKKKIEEMEKERPQEFHHYYTERLMPYPYERDMDRGMGRMYYSQNQPRNSQGEFTSYGRRGFEEPMYYGDGSSGGSGGGSNSGGSGGSSGNSSSSSGNGGGRRGYGGMEAPYFEQEFPMNMRDAREGRSPMSRRMYMESKELNKDKQKKIEELEKYMKELGEDLVEMIEDASPEEKQLLEKKITSLASKVASLNG